jgi:hypothetical protein
LCKEAEGVGFCVAEICHRRRVGKLTPGFGSANSQRPTPGQLGLPRVRACIPTPPDAPRPLGEIQRFNVPLQAGYHNHFIRRQGCAWRSVVYFSIPIADFRRSSTKSALE